MSNQGSVIWKKSVFLLFDEFFRHSLQMWNNSEFSWKPPLCRFCVEEIFWMTSSTCDKWKIDLVMISAAHEFTRRCRIIVSIFFCIRHQRSKKKIQSLISTQNDTHWKSSSIGEMYEKNSHSSLHRNAIFSCFVLT